MLAAKEYSLITYFNGQPHKTITFTKEQYNKIGIAVILVKLGLEEADQANLRTYKYRVFTLREQEDGSYKNQWLLNGEPRIYVR